MTNRSTAAGQTLTTGWVVQLGTFAQHANALRLAHRLRAKGFHVSIHAEHTRRRELWRVVAGPEATRPAAVRLTRRLRAAGVHGELLPP